MKYVLNAVTWFVLFLVPFSLHFLPHLFLDITLLRPETHTQLSEAYSIKFISKQPLGIHIQLIMTYI